MKRHEIDVLSLVSGLLFASLGLVFALNALGTITLDVGVVPAVVFIVFGLGISASVVASARSAAPRSNDPGADADPDPDPGPDAEAEPAAAEGAAEATSER